MLERCARCGARKSGTKAFLRVSLFLEQMGCFRIFSLCCQPFFASSAAKVYLSGSFLSALPASGRCEHGGEGQVGGVWRTERWCEIGVFRFTRVVHDDDLLGW